MSRKIQIEAQGEDIENEAPEVWVNGQLVTLDDDDEEEKNDA